MALRLDSALTNPTTTTTHYCTASRTCTFTTPTYEAWVAHELSTHPHAHDLWYCHHTLSHHSTFRAPDPACQQAFRTRAAFEKHFYSQHARDDLGNWSRLAHADFHVGPRGEALDGRGRLFWCGFCRRVLGCAMTGLWLVDRFEHVAGHFARAHARLEFMEMRRWGWLVVAEKVEEEEEKVKERGGVESKKKEEAEKEAAAVVLEEAVKEGKKVGLGRGEKAPVAVMVSTVEAGAGAGAGEGAGERQALARTSLGVAEIRAPETKGKDAGLADLDKEGVESGLAKKGRWLGTAITGEVVMPSATESAPMFGMIIPKRRSSRVLAEAEAVVEESGAPKEVNATVLGKFILPRKGARSS